MSDPAPPATATTPVRACWQVDGVWLLLLGVWSGVWCVNAAPQLGVTYDEPFYLAAGLDAWRGWARADGKVRGFDHQATATNGVMPLPIDAVTLPLFIQEQRTGKKFEKPLEQLHWARAVTLGWLWLLIVSGWRLGCAAGGPWAGRIAAGLLATDPNFLGHASIATTDIAATAALMAFARAVYAGRGGGWWKRLLLPGLWFGVAALCKMSALLYGGLILVSLEVCHRFASGAMSRPPGASWKAWGRKITGAVFRSVLNAAAIIVIGIAIAVAYFGIPAEGVRPFDIVARNVPAPPPLKATYKGWAEKYDQVPYAACAFAFQWGYNAGGQPTFLNGTFYPKGYRYYFPRILLMKVPLPVFLLALTALPRVRAAANPFTLVALLLFTTLLTANLQIGVRLAFPVMAIGYVAVAVAVGRGYPRCTPWLGVPTVVALVLTSAWVWPNGLGYLNQAHGGMEASAWRVSDSNVDWGHGLPDLKEWHLANGEPQIRVWYFGTDPAVDRPPFQRFGFEAQKDEQGNHVKGEDGKDIEVARNTDGNNEVIKNVADLRRTIGPRVLAVGHTVATLHPNGSPAKTVALEYLRTRRPLARTATFTLYDFRDANGPPPLE